MYQECDGSKRAKDSLRFGSTLIYQPNRSFNIPPPPRATPRAFEILEDFCSNSPLTGLKSCSNTPTPSKFVSAVSAMIYRPMWNQHDLWHEIEASDEIPNPLQVVIKCPPSRAERGVKYPGYAQGWGDV